MLQTRDLLRRLRHLFSGRSVLVSDFDIRISDFVLRAVPALLLLLSPAACAGAELECLGRRFVPDGGFYHVASGRHGFFIPRLDAGARLQLYLKNTGAAPLEVRGLRIAGKPFEELPPVPIGRHNPDSKWWLLWPNPIPPGAVATLRLRIADLEAIPEGPVQIDLLGADRVETFHVPRQTSPLWLPFIGFSADLKRVTIYAANRGDTAIRLTAGSVHIDASPTPAALPETEIQPGGVVPLILDLAEPLVAGRETFFQVAAKDGQTACGAIRVFPSRFGVTLWDGHVRLDEDDARRHHIDRDVPGDNHVVDEPIGNRVPTMALRDRILGLLRKTPERPLLVQYSGYEENLIYADMADVHMTHHGNTEQDLSLYLTWPKPIWYLPQNAWGRKEGIGKPEHWYPLEDLGREALEGIAHGAKNIQWFVYANLWDQGYERRGGHDFGRIFQDFFMPGAIGNPVLWDRVGRISGVLQVVGPYLAVSCPLPPKINPQGIEVTTLVSGTDKAVVVLVDHRTPTAFYKQTQPVQRQQVLYGQTVRVGVPRYVRATHAFAVDPLAGVVPIEAKAAPGEWELHVPEISGAAIIVLGNTGDGATLKQAWDERSRTFCSSDDARRTLRFASAEHPAAPWRAPECSYRVACHATNQGSQPAAVLSGPIGLPLRRHVDPLSVRVYEVAGPRAQAVPFHAEVEKAFEDFSQGEIERRFEFHPTPKGKPQLWRHVLDGNRLVSYGRAPQEKTQVWYKVAPKDPQPWGQGPWVPIEFGALRFEINRRGCPHMLVLNVQFDFDGDGREDGGLGYWDFHGPEVVQIQRLDESWERVELDLHHAFRARWPDRALAGRYKFWFQVILRPNSPEGEYGWSLRHVSVGGGRLTVKPAQPLAPRESRDFEVYFDLKANRKLPGTASVFAPAAGTVPIFAPAEMGLSPSEGPKIERSPSRDPAPAQTGLPASKGSETCNESPLADPSLAGRGAPCPFETSAPQPAGVAVRVDGKRISAMADAVGSGLFLRWIDATGSVRFQQFLPAASDRRREFHLPAASSPDHMLCAVPVQPGGEGALFCFDGRGKRLSPQDRLRETKALRVAWSQPADEPVWSLGSTPDGDQFLVAQGKSVRLLARDGTPLWTKDYPGRVFYAVFSQDHSRVYVATNLEEPRQVAYPEAHVLAYDRHGKQLWKHKVGQTVFALAGGFSDQGLALARYDGRVFRLGPDGQVLWDAPGGSFYTWDIQPLADGGMLLTGTSGLVRLDPNGKPLRRFPGKDHAMTGASTPDAGLLALGGFRLHLADGEGREIAAPYLGRFVRTLRIAPDGQHVACGSCDGQLSLVDRSGQVLWTRSNPASYVTAVEFLPHAKGLVAAREVFDYAPATMWRFRDQVEAYDLAGNLLWQHDGPWRTRSPSMNRFVLSSDGRRLLLAAGGDVRLMELPGKDAQRKSE